MAKLQKLNKDASKVMRAILARIPEGDTAVKIADNDAYMPLCVERVDWWLGDILNAFPEYIKEKFAVSLCHYGEQNGDAMRDPEVVFLCYKIDDEWHYVPATYRQDYYGVDREYIFVRDGRIVFNSAGQRDLKDFCNMWMKNLNEQQKILDAA